MFSKESRRFSEKKRTFPMYRRTIDHNISDFYGNLKKTKRIFQKVLTKGDGFDIIVKRSRDTAKTPRGPTAREWLRNETFGGSGTEEEKPGKESGRVQKEIGKRSRKSPEKKTEGTQTEP